MPALKSCWVLDRFTVRLGEVEGGSTVCRASPQLGTGCKLSTRCCVVHNLYELHIVHHQDSGRTLSTKPLICTVSHPVFHRNSPHLNTPPPPFPPPKSKPTTHNPQPCNSPNSSRSPPSPQHNSSLPSPTPHASPHLSFPPPLPPQHPHPHPPTRTSTSSPPPTASGPAAAASKHRSRTTLGPSPSHTCAAGRARTSCAARVAPRRSWRAPGRGPRWPCVCVRAVGYRIAGRCARVFVGSGMGRRGWGMYSGRRRNIARIRCGLRMSAGWACWRGRWSGRGGSGRS